jgi:hypothetical protein
VKESLPTKDLSMFFGDISTRSFIFICPLSKGEKNNNMKVVISARVATVVVECIEPLCKNVNRFLFGSAVPQVHDLALKGQSGNAVV